MTEACISATMESYLMMLYVTLEQESALKNFFVDHGWTFCKPDLTVTTDRLGPAVRDVQADSVPSEGDFNPRLLGKRKVRRKQNKAPVIKLAKIIPAPSSSKTNVQTLDNVQADSDISEQLDDEPNEAELQDIGDIEGSSNVGPKIKAETLDSSFNEDYDDDNDDNEDDDDDDIDTDVDESYEEAKADGEMEADVTERDEAEDETGVTEEAVRTKASKQKGVKKKNALTKKEKKENVPRCVTCQHFEKQAMILDKGPGIPDKNEDEPNVYICDICGKQFIHKSTYKKHVRSHEETTHEKSERERKWKCNDCTKVFGSEGNLKEHIGQVHLKQPGEFMCHLCLKSYTRASRLEGHLNSHYGIKPYSCKSCHTPFYGKSTLIDHQKKCEGGVTVRFRCQFCLVYFGSQTELKLHRTQEHSNEFCFAPCGKKIRWKASLKRHTATCVKCKDIETANSIISGT